MSVVKSIPVFVLRASILIALGGCGAESSADLELEPSNEVFVEQDEVAPPETADIVTDPPVTMESSLSFENKIRFWSYFSSSSGTRYAPIRNGHWGFGWKKMHEIHNIDDEDIIKRVVNRGQRTRCGGRTIIRAKLVDAGPACSCNPWRGVHVTVRVGLEMEDEKPDGYVTGGITAFCEKYHGACPTFVNQFIYKVQYPDTKYVCP